MSRQVSAFILCPIQKIRNFCGYSPLFRMVSAGERTGAHMCTSLKNLFHAWLCIWSRALMYAPKVADLHRCTHSHWFVEATRSAHSSQVNTAWPQLRFDDSSDVTGLASTRTRSIVSSHQHQCGARYHTNQTRTLYTCDNVCESSTHGRSIRTSWVASYVRATSQLMHMPSWWHAVGMLCNPYHRLEPLAVSAFLHPQSVYTFRPPIYAGRFLACLVVIVTRPMCDYIGSHYNSVVAKNIAKRL